MAIKGYLGEINFVEILKIVGKLSGRLTIWNFADKKQYECFFYDNSVAYLTVSGAQVQTKETAKEIFFELLTDNQSYYAFQDEKPSAGLSTTLVSVAEVLDFTLFEKPDVPANEELLPHIDTKFEVTGKTDVSTPGSLVNFWKTIILHINRGCSGRDLCVAFGFEENEVRQNLYRLRTAGLIKPIRMFNAANPALRNKMMGQNLSKIANRLNEGQKTNQPVNQQLTETVNGLQENQAFSVNAAQNSAANHSGNQMSSAMPRDFSQSQNNVIANSETNAEEIPNPSRPVILTGQPLESDAPQAAVSPVFAPQHNNSETGQTFAKSMSILNSSGVNFQNSVKDSGHPAPTYSVNISGNHQSAPEKEPEKPVTNYVVPEKTNLIKRMLSSLFSR